MIQEHDDVTEPEAHAADAAVGMPAPISRERKAALLHCGVAMLVCSGLPQPSLAEFLR